jgi:tripartite-type tricarboxylate transporter receptor subunit TctC
MIKTRAALAAFCMVASVLASAVHAQGYPSKTIRVIVPIGPAAARTSSGGCSQRLSEQMGVTLYVDNRPGAGAVIGTELVAKSPPDGYTLLEIAVEFTINPALAEAPVRSDQGLHLYRAAHDEPVLPVHASGDTR